MITLRQGTRRSRIFLDSLRHKYRSLTGTASKIFVIGRNKTGTTSLRILFKSLGYIVGDQETAERLLPDYTKRDFRRLLDYCDSAEVFQDAPFSWPDTYRHLYRKYPEAKYILTERDSPRQWYDSLVRFHGKMVGSNGPPTASDLQSFVYRWPGFLWDVQKAVYGADEHTLYDRDLYIANYVNHNEAIKAFFEGKDNLLVLNLSSPSASQRLADFLGVPSEKIAIPHANKSGD